MSPNRTSRSADTGSNSYGTSAVWGTFPPRRAVHPGTGREPHRNLRIQSKPPAGGLCTSDRFAGGLCAAKKCAPGNRNTSRPHPSRNRRWQEKSRPKMVFPQHGHPRPGTLLGMRRGLHTCPSLPTSKIGRRERSVRTLVLPAGTIRFRACARVPRRGRRWSGSLPGHHGLRHSAEPWWRIPPPAPAGPGWCVPPGPD